jgi:hypothetical protein
MRWLVERARGTDNFEDVGADDVAVVDGCLVFRNRYTAAPDSHHRCRQVEDGFEWVPTGLTTGEVTR